MSLLPGISARKVLGVALLATTMFAATAGAVTLRSPQIVFASAVLQGNLNAWDGGINASTDQLDGQVFATGVSGNTDFTLLIKLGANAGNNTIGVYNAGAGPSPTLYQLFPSTATADYSVFCHFTTTGTLVVSLFDASATFLGSTTYTGVTRNNFGFYIQGPGGTFYSQDSRNGSLAQMLTYAGTGINIGDWFECFNDTPYTPAATFDSAVLLLQSVAPGVTPTNSTTWGALKSSYR